MTCPHDNGFDEHHRCNSCGDMLYLTHALRVGQAIASEFNRCWPPYTPVRLIEDSGEVLLTRTCSPAWTLASGQAVVSVDCRSGGYALERLIVDPVQ